MEVDGDARDEYSENLIIDVLDRLIIEATDDDFLTLQIDKFIKVNDNDKVVDVIGICSDDNLLYNAVNSINNNRTDTNKSNKCKICGNIKAGPVYENDKENPNYVNFINPSICIDCNIKMEHLEDYEDEDTNNHDNQHDTKFDDQQDTKFDDQYANAVDYPHCIDSSGLQKYIILSEKKATLFYYADTSEEIQHYYHEDLNKCHTKIFFGVDDTTKRRFLLLPFYEKSSKMLYYCLFYDTLKQTSSVMTIDLNKLKDNEDLKYRSFLSRVKDSDDSPVNYVSIDICYSAFTSGTEVVNRADLATNPSGAFNGMFSMTKIDHLFRKMIEKSFMAGMVSRDRYKEEAALKEEEATLKAAQAVKDLQPKSLSKAPEKGGKNNKAPEKGGKNSKTKKDIPKQTTPIISRKRGRSNNTNNTNDTNTNDTNTIDINTNDTNDTNTNTTIITNTSNTTNTHRTTQQQQQQQQEQATPTTSNTTNNNNNNHHHHHQQQQQQQQAPIPINHQQLYPSYQLSPYQQPLPPFAPFPPYGGNPFSHPSPYNINPFYPSPYGSIPSGTSSATFNASETSSSTVQASNSTFNITYNIGGPQQQHPPPYYPYPLPAPFPPQPQNPI